MRSGPCCLEGSIDGKNIVRSAGNAVSLRDLGGDLGA
jgi:hypothetical protein